MFLDFLQRFRELSLSANLLGRSLLGYKTICELCRFRIAFNCTEELGEILLDWREIHLVQAHKERRLRISISLTDELHKRRSVVLSAVHLSVVTKEIGRVMPVWLHLNHAIVAGGVGVILLFQKLLVITGHIGKPTHKLTLASPRMSSENCKRLGAKRRHKALQHFIVFYGLGKLARSSLGLLANVLELLAHYFLLDLF